MCPCKGASRYPFWIAPLPVSTARRQTSATVRFKRMPPAVISTYRCSPVRPPTPMLPSSLRAWSQSIPSCDVVGQECCILANPGHQGGLALVKPGQTEKIKSGDAGHPTRVHRLTPQLLVTVRKDRHLNPAKVMSEPGRPKDGRDTSSFQIEVLDRERCLLRILHPFSRDIIIGKIEPIPLCICVSSRHELLEPLVTPQQGSPKVRRKGEFALLSGQQPAKQHDTIIGQAAQIDVVPSTDPGQEWRHPLSRALIHRAIKLPKSELPIRKVSAPVAARYTAMGTHGEIDAATAPQKIFGDLTTRGSRADHKDRSRRQAVRIAVATRMNLENPIHFTDDGGDCRLLVGAGRDHHVGSRDARAVCLDLETSGTRLH